MAENRLKEPAIAQDAITQLVLATKTQGHDAAIALPVSTIISKRIKLYPAMTDEECEMEILSNLNQYFPGLAEDLCFDYQKVAEDEFFVVAARREQVSEYVDLVNHAGLQVKVMDVDSFALARAVDLLNVDVMLAVLEVHSYSANFMVFQHREIIFSQAIALAELVQGLKRALQLCYSMHDFRVITLAGDDIQPDLKELIQQELNVQLIPANPFLNMSLSPDIQKNELQRAAPHLLVSCGLAMRSVQW